MIEQTKIKKFNENFKKIKKTVNLTRKKIILIGSFLFFLFVSLFIIGFLLSLITEDLAIKFSPAQISETVFQGENKNLSLKLEIDSSPMCFQKCEYELIDISKGELLSSNEFNIFILSEKKFKIIKEEISAPSIGIGQKIYNLKVECRNLKTPFCITTGSWYEKTALITLNYNFNPEKQELQNKTKQELEKILYSLNETDFNYQKSDYLIRTLNNSIIIENKIINNQIINQLNLDNYFTFANYLIDLWYEKEDYYLILEKINEDISFFIDLTLNNSEKNNEYIQKTLNIHNNLSQNINKEEDILNILHYNSIESNLNLNLEEKEFLSSYEKFKSLNFTNYYEIASTIYPSSSYLDSRFLNYLNKIDSQRKINEKIRCETYGVCKEENISMNLSDPLISLKEICKSISSEKSNFENSKNYFAYNYVLNNGIIIKDLTLNNAYEKLYEYLNVSDYLSDAKFIEEKNLLYDYYLIESKNFQINNLNENIKETNLMFGQINEEIDFINNFNYSEKYSKQLISELDLQGWDKEERESLSYKINICSEIINQYNQEADVQEIDEIIGINNFNSINSSKKIELSKQILENCQDYIYTAYLILNTLIENNKNQSQIDENFEEKNFELINKFTENQISNISFMKEINLKLNNKSNNQIKNIKPISTFDETMLLMSIDLRYENNNQNILYLFDNSFCDTLDIDGNLKKEIKEYSFNLTNIPFPEFNEFNQTINVTLKKPELICCVFGVCNSCCINNSCSNDSKTYPVILIHGHSFNKENSPEYSLEGLNEIKSALETAGYIDAGTIIPSSQYYQIPEGEWGYSGSPIVLKLSYYYDVYDENGTIIDALSKSEHIETYSDRLKYMIDLIKYRTGKDKVNIIAHSMGGIVARKYIQKYGEDNIDKLIMIGTPNYGILGNVEQYCPILGEKIECYEMKKNSTFLNELNNYSYQNKTKITTIIGTGCITEGFDGDGVVVSRNVNLSYANNTYINGTCKNIFEPLHEEMLKTLEYPMVFEIIKNALT